MDMPELIRTNAPEARARILLAFSNAGASSSRAAVLLGVSVWTFGRWVEALDLRLELVQRRSDAKREGWAAKNDRGKRGPDVEVRKSRKAADAKRARKKKAQS